MVEINDDGWAIYQKAAKSSCSRQKAPKCFDLNASIYYMEAAALLECNELFLPKTTL